MVTFCVTCCFSRLDCLVIKVSISNEIMLFCSAMSTMVCHLLFCARMWRITKHTSFLRIIYNSKNKIRLYPAAGAPRLWSPSKQNPQKKWWGSVNILRKQFFTAMATGFHQFLAFCFCKNSIQMLLFLPFHWPIHSLVYKSGIHIHNVYLKFKAA